MKKYGLKLKIWWNEEMHLWMLRSIYVERTDQLLDMHNDDHYMVFDEMLPDSEKSAIMKTISQLESGSQNKEEKEIRI